MATFTTNLNLEKPDLTENYDINVINNNSDVLDTAIKEIQDTLATINTTLQSIQSTLSTLQSQVTTNSSSIGTLNTKVTTLENNSLTFVKTGEF